MTIQEATERLTNPVFRALTTCHAGFAERYGSMLRYQPRVLPFAAVEEAGTELRADVVLADGTVFFCDLLPKIVGEGFSAEVFPVPQMLYVGEPQSPQRLVNEMELTMADSAAMVDLADAAFLGFFRAESPLLGRYIGLREGDQLIAMVGERFQVPGLREISAVCTRPGHTGKGYATHLIHRLMSTDSHDQSFLHVSGDNHRAIAIYERLGFAHLRTMDVLKVTAS